MNRVIKFLIAFMLIIALPIQAAESNEFKIYAVKYGKSQFNKRFVFYGEKSNENINFCWMLYYIEFNDKKILIDTGFNDVNSVKVFGIKDFKDPVIILQENKIDPDSITDVIITHRHFDHVGNAHKFKNAKFIINRDELISIGNDKNLKAVSNFFKGNKNITVFDKEITLYNFFKIQKIGGHTAGSSVIFFYYKNEKYCFTGDEFYLPDNIEKNTGSGTVFNHRKNIDFLKFLTINNYKLFLFHDNRYFDSSNFIKVFDTK
jgi:glyoxylase-like metal-dependent hydrolase (beta-lactamase superfamily II)